MASEKRVGGLEDAKGGRTRVEVAGPLSLWAALGGGILDEAKPAASLMTMVSGGGAVWTSTTADDTLGTSGAMTDRKSVV